MEERDLKNLIKNAGLNYTKPRKAILELLEKKHGPFSAEEIFKQLGPGVCDQATIFRTLKQFSTKGLVNTVTLHEGFVRYEYNDPTHHHHHLICRNCQKLETIDECDVLDLENKLAKKGYTQLSHSLEFFGLCPQCSDS